MGDLVPVRLVRLRHDGWSEWRQTAFLAELAASGSVSAACAAVGKSTTSAYKARDRLVDFARRWDESLALARPKLEAEALRRGVEGWDEPVFQGGKQVGVKRRYSDAMLRMLYLRGTQDKGVATDPDVQIQNVPIEEVQEEILQRLDALARHERKRAAAAAAEAARVAAAEADDMRRRGPCP